MKMYAIIILILGFMGCNKNTADISEFENTICNEFARQSGYPIEICNCVDETIKKFENLTKVTPENIEKLVNDCIQNNLGTSVF